MARTSKIVMLGIEREVHTLWDQHRDYTRVAHMLNQQGHEVSPLQVKGFLETHSEYVAAEAEEEGELAEPHELVTQFEGKASIFEPLQALDEHYKYATRLMNASPSFDTKHKFQKTQLEILKLVIAIQDRLASYETVFAFQQAVLEVLGRADPTLVQQVFTELEQRKSLRTILTERSIPKFDP